MLKRFFAFYRPYRGLFILDFSCAVLSGLLELGFPIAVKLFVDQLLPSGNWSLIVLASLGLLAIYLINAGLMVELPFLEETGASGIGIRIDSWKLLANVDASSVDFHSPKIVLNPRE